MLAFHTEIAKRTQKTHYQDWHVLMGKVNKLQKELQIVQSEVQKFQLQNNIDWKAIVVENQVKVMLYDQLMKDSLVELIKTLEEAKAKFKRWHPSKSKSTLML